MEKALNEENTHLEVCGDDRPETEERGHRGRHLSASGSCPRGGGSGKSVAPEVADAAVLC